MKVKNWQPDKVVFFKGERVTDVKPAGDGYAKYYPNGEYLVYTEGNTRAYHLDGNVKLKQTKILWW